MTEPEERLELQLAEGRLEAGWWGRRPGLPPTLLLLHEGLGSLGLWRDFPSRLAAVTGCRVFAYSRFGYGRSAPAALPRPLDYMRIEATGVLPRVLDAAGIAGPLVLVGHSDGATVAAYYAARVPDARLCGLVLVAPHFFVEPVCTGAIAKVCADYAGGLRARLARHHDDPDAAFSGWADAWLDPRFPGQLDLRPDLPAIRVPVLILQGTEDPYGTDAHARAAERFCGGPVRTVLLAAGHAPHREHAARTLEETARFLRGVSEGSVA
ncbi:MAG TPA: alpha/beta fold hydrolase [Acetobacteraceae bacterium]|nr:alpha/beta fold hydrolase [Acetobacteraceae bacterium]